MVLAHGPWAHGPGPWAPKYNIFKNQLKTWAPEPDPGIRCLDEPSQWGNIQKGINIYETLQKNINLSTFGTVESDVVRIRVKTRPNAPKKLHGWKVAIIGNHSQISKWLDLR